MDPSQRALAAVITRLALHSALSEEEERAVLGLKGHAIHVAGKSELMPSGRSGGHATIVVDGILGCVDVMRSGARQVTGIYLPGDTCNLHPAFVSNQFFTWLP